ncbi:MAG: hypothetical protein Q9211_000840 [Gyalolechia sp. 1 TL-2023]
MLLTRCRFNSKTTVRNSCRTLSTSYKTKTGERRVSEQLPSTPARTRFAPSPTGYLHLGSLRTALFNYLLARATGGQFLLRVEDTDRSERTSLYQEHSEKLLQSGHAYRCFCSSEKLNEVARQRASLGLPSDYDRTCEGIPFDESNERASTGEAFVIRLRVPAEPPEYVDLVYGLVGKPNRNKKAQKHGEVLYEDPVLLKSDGLPTYHLANVVDDHYMRITHVVRAAEWMSSTPKHLLLYHAFGWKPPEFAHVGLLQDSSHQKFSKRKGDLSIRRFEEQGIFPEALLNYVALYGWSHTKTSDVMSLSDLVESFDLKFTRGNTVVEPHKLWYLQKKYATKYANENGPQFNALVKKVFEKIQQEFETPSWNPESTYPHHLIGPELETRIAGVLRHTAKSYTTTEEFFNNYKYFFYDAPFPSIDHLGEMRATCETLWPQLNLVNVKLCEVLPGNWTDAGLKETTVAMVDTLSQELDESSRKIYQIIQFYLRWAIARGGSGPPIHTAMVLLGRDTCLQRLRELAAILDSNPRKAATETDSK